MAIEIYNEDYKVNRDALTDITEFIYGLSAMKRDFGNIEDYFNDPWKSLAKDLGKRMNKEGKVTFDDLIYEVCKYFEKNIEDLEKFSKKYKYILVDE